MNFKSIVRMLYVVILIMLLVNIMTWQGKNISEMQTNDIMQEKLLSDIETNKAIMDNIKVFDKFSKAVMEVSE